MGSGYMTDEELDLCHTIEHPSMTTPNEKSNKPTTNDHKNSSTTPKVTNNASPHNTTMTNETAYNTRAFNATTSVADSLTSPTVKEVLIGGDNNPSRR